MCPRSGSRLAASALCALAVLALATPEARAQDPQPRPFANAPVGVNFALAAFAFTDGAVVTDPTLPLRDGRIRADTLTAAYVRTLDVLGYASKIQLIVPYTSAAGSARLDDGEQRSRSVSALGDPSARFIVNFYGAPVLDLAGYRSWRQELIVGASLQVSAPLGQYDPSKLLNIGTNRWSIQPALGISKAHGPWFFDLSTGATFYTVNRDFLGQVRRQDPLYSIDGFVVRNFGPDLFLVLFGTYYTGGQTTLDGVSNHNRQGNSRVGISLSLPVNRRNSLRIFASNRLHVRVGGSFLTVGVAWQYRWGGGL